MTDLTLDCSACGKKFRISFAVKPKQVVCPQCKAKVNTSSEAVPDVGTAPSNATPPATGAVASAATDAANQAAAPTAKARASTPPQTPQSKPKRHHAHLKSEEVEFKGWTYDFEAAKARSGMQHADVMGIVWIGGVLLMGGFILFRLLRDKLVGEVVMGLGGVGLLYAGYLLLQLRGKADGASCIRCRSLLGLVHTVPTVNDCKANKYMRGVSGHAYRLDNGPTKKYWEVHKKWHVCKACKRYFIADKESLDFVGATKADLEKREELYAEAAAAAAAAAAAKSAPQPAPVAPVVPVVPTVPDAPVAPVAPDAPPPGASTPA